MRRSSSQLVSEIVHDRTGRADGYRQVATAETVQRLNAELLTKQVRSLIQLEGVAVIGRGAWNLANEILIRIRNQNFRRAEASQFVFERVKRIHLGHSKFAGADVEERQSVQLLQVVARRLFRRG